MHSIHTLTYHPVPLSCIIKLLPKYQEVDDIRHVMVSKTTTEMWVTGLKATQRRSWWISPCDSCRQYSLHRKRAARQFASVWVQEGQLQTAQSRQTHLKLNAHYLQQFLLLQAHNHKSFPMFYHVHKNTVEVKVNFIEDLPWALTCARAVF